MKRPHYLIIKNSKSGTGKAHAYAQFCQSYLEKKGIIYTCYTIHDFPIVNMHQYDVLVVIGGDGTLHHIAQSFPLDFKAPILMLPAGTANLIAKSLKIPRDVFKAVELCSRVNTVDWPIVKLKPLVKGRRLLQLL